MREYLVLLITLFFVSCSINTEKDVFIKNRDGFINVQRIIVDNISYPSDTISKNSIVPITFNPKSKWFKEGMSFDKKNKIQLSKIDFDIIDVFCKNLNVNQIAIGGNDLVLFLIKVNNGYLRDKWHYIVYCSNKTLLSKLNYEILDINEIEENWYTVIRRTSIAAD
jgi:hypothetical protein